MIDTAAARRFYAGEIEAIANLSTARLVDALAAVPRERFLGAGPWIVQGGVDLTSGPRPTPDDDPSRVYHNYSVAIDPSRQLFNGAPSLIASAIDRLQIGPGGRVLHVGTGSGYYTALLAHVVGPSGRVVGIEIDEDLAAAARRNLADMPWAQIVTGNGRGPFGETFDGVLVNAGVTHPESAWLDAVETGGRLVLPLTATMPMMKTIGKGVQILLHKESDGGFGAHILTLVAIYSAVDLRDESLNRRIGEALQRSPFPRFTRLRRDAHAEASTCWLHGDGWCWSA
jgi:protein-L-isoaspartate(D-aspartate) O-methyltransferase